MKKGIYNPAYGDYMVRDENGQPLYDSRCEPAFKRHWSEYEADPTIDIRAFIREYGDKLDYINGRTDFNISASMFNDDRIERTITEYNYDYGRLLHMLACFYSSEEFNEIINDCFGDYKIEPNILAPTKEVFEIIRNRIIHGKEKSL